MELNYPINCKHYDNKICMRDKKICNGRIKDCENYEKRVERKEK